MVNTGCGSSEIRLICIGRLIVNQRQIHVPIR
jgi:hypothetical protein